MLYLIKRYGFTVIILICLSGCKGTINSSTSSSSSSSSSSGIAIEFSSWTNQPLQPLNLPIQQTNRLSAGVNNNIVRQDDGSVVSWGTNTRGQARAPESLTSATRVKAGSNRSPSYAITEEGKIVYWGLIQPTVNIDQKVVIDIIPEFETALLDDGSLYSWQSMQLGIDYSNSGFTDVVALSTTDDSGFATLLRNDGTLATIGNQAFAPPANISENVGIKAIAAGLKHGLALTDVGTVIAWGDNEKGQSSVPEGLENVIAVSAGITHSLALKADGTVVEWGELYATNTDQPPEVTMPETLSDVVAISAGTHHNLAMKSDGTIEIWGYYIDANLITPEKLINSININQRISIKEDGSVTSWHRTPIKTPNNINNAASTELGFTFVPETADNMAVNLQIQTPALGKEYPLLYILKDDGAIALTTDLPNNILDPSHLVDISSIATDGDGGIALKNDGTVTSWGEGECQSSLPQDLHNVISIKSGASHCIALKSDGTVIGWGAGERKLPITEIPNDLTDVVAIEMAVGAGAQYGLALKSDGTVTSWGYAFSFFGTRELARVPENMNNVKVISADGTTAAALKNDGTVVAWKSGSSSLDPDALSAPEGLNDVVSIDVFEDSVYAIQANGKLLVWGENLWIPENFYDLLPEQ